MLSNWPVAPTATKDVPKEQPKDSSAIKPTGFDEKLNKGRNVAVVSINGVDGLPALNTSMIHELPDRWKIDVPDNVDGQMIKDNLQKHLFALGQDAAKWPADVNEAYRLVTHHVLMAVYNIDMPEPVKK